MVWRAIRAKLAKIGVSYAFPAGRCVSPDTGFGDHGGGQVEGAVKHDQGKVRMDLVPPAAIRALAEVYTVGAAKYGEHNWRKGMKWSRIFAAVLRHLTAWAMGEELDPEDGLPHLAHAMWGLVTLMEYKRLGLGVDDLMRE